MIRLLLLYLFVFFVLSACSQVIPKKDNTDDVRSRVDASSVDQRISSQHVKIIVEQWGKGNIELAKEQWQALSGLVPDEKQKQMLFMKFVSHNEYKLIKELISDEEIKLDNNSERIDTLVEQLDKTNGQAKEFKKTVKIDSQKEWLDNELKNILMELGEDGEIQVPDEMRKNVNVYIERFTDPKRLRPWFGRSLNRMDKYLPTIHNIFSKKHLPESLYYLALVESGFNPYAKSSAGAVGMWQFMPATGRQYGLKITRKSDQRKSPKRSTTAAREYLLDLILEFGDGDSMLLAMAAYNAGEGRIRSRLRRLEDYRLRSFWELSKKGLLPKETKQYIPKIIAATIIGRNRSKFGFEESSISLARAERIKLHKSVSIPYLLEKGQFNKKQLVKLNSDLYGKSVTPSKTSYELLITKQVKDDLVNDPIIKTAMKPDLVKPKKSVKQKNSPSKKKKSKKEVYISYKVKQGNSWSGISQWSGVTVKKLKKDNYKIAKRGLRKGDHLYLRGIDPQLRLIKYKVKSGDSLSELSEQFRVSQKKIKSWNGMRRNDLRKSEILELYLKKLDEAKVIQLAKQEKKKSLRKPKLIKSSKKSKLKKKTYLSFKVQRNNTLGTIANAFNIRVSKLKTTNGLRSNTIHPGQILKIPVSSLKLTKYKVKRGDTLAIVGKSFGVSSRALQTYNGLRHSRIYVGEILYVYN